MNLDLKMHFKSLFLIFLITLAYDGDAVLPLITNPDESTDIHRGDHQHQHHSAHGHARHGHQHQQHSWGYDDNNGPHTWTKQCRVGTRQSPVDIRTSNLEFALINEMHFVNYDVSGQVELRNNGHTVVVSGFEKWGQRERPYIYGGGLTGKYVLAQFHFHWAVESEKGSEHTVNALHYPMELHLVHVKEGLSLQEALEEPDGLAVVGVFYHIGSEGASMANLESALKRVVEKDASSMIFNYTVGVHLPQSTDSFYRYHGSLTTPECNEAVVWTVLAEPLPILAQQLELFWTIQGALEPKPHVLGADLRMYANVRPVQPLNGRRVQFRSSALNRHKLCNATSPEFPSRNGVNPPPSASLISLATMLSVAIIFATIDQFFMLKLYS